MEQSTKFGTPNTKKIKAPGEIYGDYQMEFIISQVRVAEHEAYFEPLQTYAPNTHDVLVDD